MLDVPDPPILPPHPASKNENHPSSPSASVILVCGLPASGKSTLVRKLANILKQKHPLNHPETPNSMSVHVIEYDMLEDELLVQHDCMPTSTAMEYRPSQEEEEDPDAVAIDDEGQGVRRREAWNKARQLAERQLQNILDDHHQVKGGADDVVVLMDENFHLRGMRKRIHRLLLHRRREQQQAINFGIVWVQTPASVCLERNSQRTRRVPSHVIVKMAEYFEPPHRVAWEANSLLVTESTPFNEILLFVSNCPPIVELPNHEEMDTKEVAGARAATQQSQIYKMDQLLRSWVSKVAQMNKSLAGAANEARKELLQQRKLRSAAADMLLPTMDNGSFPLLECFVHSVLVKTGHSDDANALHMSLKLSLLEISTLPST